MPVSNVLVVVGDMMLIVILWRGIAARLIRHYPLFYLYILLALAISAVRTAVFAAYGWTSTAYYSTWHITSVVIGFTLLLVLFEVWKKIEPGDSLWTRLRLRPIILLATAVGVVTVGLTTRQGDPYLKFDAVLLFAQMLSCIFLYSRVTARRDMMLGGNLKGILSGTGLLVGLQGVNFARFLFADASPQVFAFFIQFVYLLTLLVFAYYLWSFSPPGQIGPSLRGRIDRVGQDLQKVIKTLSR